ncbi:TetR/AcrR family transcriptional regulator [Verrucomicrobium spinosum]|uniref:TetR/AcrR family transcriptional regulator n=1 Tax=Verrucomicrobium spinosum TaxID=2736 RepID=UPI000946749D|nr:helix-turn-helix domain-containing protein [Verrucomicrobium spinosum]
MSRPPRSAQATTDLKDHILSASRTILVNEGYEALSMRRLAREIGYSATALYLYFENREPSSPNSAAAALRTWKSSCSPH